MSPSAGGSRKSIQRHSCAFAELPRDLFKLSIKKANWENVEPLATISTGNILRKDFYLKAVEKWNVYMDRVAWPRSSRIDFSKPDKLLNLEEASIGGSALSVLSSPISDGDSVTGFDSAEILLFSSVIDEI
ncbi:hypothetical protein B0H13DRAFT_1907226 [Mycena leptocephala]|nr:hypothetical protein B0H13DRAFT_1907226 [Mycena leptocephala]